MHGLEKTRDDCQDAAERAETEAARAQAGIGAPFPKATDLAAARAEAARIQAELDKLARTPEQAPALAGAAS